MAGIVKKEMVVVPRNLFHRAHYNIIAAQIRDVFNNCETTDERTVICGLALGLANRFVEDNPNFQPLQFLDACSPDVDIYPLSELWEDQTDGD